MDIHEEIKQIEEEIRKTPYNKATQFHIGKQKAKLAKLRQELQKRSVKKAGLGYGIRKSGDATVLLIGFPSVGKSTLINRITRADSKIGEYDFTTLNVIPGVMEYRGARIQVLDVPGLVEGASEGKGRGREILSVVRNADLVLIMIDASNSGKAIQQLDIIERELHNAGFRLNQKPPDVVVQKRNTGGISVGSAVRLTRMSVEGVKSILHEFRVNNAEVTIREDISQDQLIDAVMGNRVYIPSLVIANKADLLDDRGVLAGLKNCIMISALKNTNIDALREAIWDGLGLIRIYMKKAGRKPDMREPLIMKRGSSVNDVCLKIHRDFESGFVFARVWGSSRFPGQKVGVSYALKDMDVVELHIDKLASK
jgi:small GTP-binding protein